MASFALHPEQVEDYGRTEDDQLVQLVTIKLDQQGDTPLAQISTYGAALVKCLIPGRNDNGEITNTDVVLGYEDLSAYERNPPSFGVIIGRVAGRIQYGRFIVPNSGVPCEVSKNMNGRHCIHGGFKGLSHVIWKIIRITGHSVLLRYTSPNGEDGFPGTLQVDVEYSFRRIAEGIILNIDYDASLTASPKASCPINLTNHTYWNLAGHSAGRTELANHMVYIDADRYVETSLPDLIPTGRIVDIEPKSLYDLRVLRSVKPGLEGVGDPKRPGYDTYYVFNQHLTPNIPYATVVHPGSGRRMRLFTDQPGVQFYTANHLGDKSDPIGKHGQHYESQSALCLEAQGYPDACNQPNFPMNVVCSGSETYKQRTSYLFDIDEQVAHSS